MDWKGNQGHGCIRANFHLLTIIKNGEHGIAVSTIGETELDDGITHPYETIVFAFSGERTYFQTSECMVISKVLSNTREMAQVAHNVEVRKFSEPEMKSCLICGELRQVDEHRICEECRWGVPCYTCSLNKSCDYAFSGYNYDGHCVRYGVAVEGGSKVQYEALDGTEVKYDG